MTTSSGTPAIALDGSSLTVADLVAIAREPIRVSASDDAIEGLDQAHERLTVARESGTVYGANTGVGANRSVSVGDHRNPAENAAHAKRLLNSHCAGIGPLEGDVTTRAVMVVRLNQFLAGGSGISSAVGRGLLDALDTGSVPALHRFGAIGTGDLAALAELALTLAGSRRWLSGGIAPVTLSESDALPFMSSSAVTLAYAALGAHDLKCLLDSGAVVAALSFLALQGSAEAYDDAVHQSRAHPGQVEIAGVMRGLVGAPTGTPVPTSARLQDPFGLRAIPQVHAPAGASLKRLGESLEIEVNASAENPLVTPHGVRHHGQFHAAALASALDHTRTSIYPVLTLSAARLGLLLRPEMTGLAPFLSADQPGSSGLMITEYVVQDILAELRVAVAPVSGSSVSISLGMEEHASFATQGARLLRDVASAAPTILAIEAVAAVRALRLAPDRLKAAPARQAYELLADELDADLTDRPLGEDIERAASLLPRLGLLVGDRL